MQEFSALENVMMPMRKLGRLTPLQMEARARELLGEVGLAEKAHRLGTQLSGGEQQRVAVCRSLINKPAIIFADEPSGNLDSKNAGELHELFLQLREEFKQTFVIVTHNEKLAQMADRTLVMKDGNFI